MMPFWESQRKRGVSRMWKVVADSVNPNFSGAQSHNVRALSMLSPNSRVGTISPWASPWIRDPLPVGTNWRGDQICYPVENHRDERVRTAYAKINSDFVEFLKWDARAHICAYRPLAFAAYSYVKDGEIIPHDVCRCCILCPSKLGHCGLPNNRSGACQRSLCGACCKDSDCKAHKRFRKRHQIAF